MKVLFAVSSESISEAIIKRYQKEYKEILSYKNVYYFNAILKEIQKDKTYDRIIISEDLEPFSNNNYDTIDKFIFDKLDSISDEAQDSHGKETSIILICTDRRVKGNSILVKLFGIGVYNALLGNDRSMDEVCKLINKPRTKKEAKMYYRIDTDDVNYKAENENEVSEVEIQNILTHFKKIGRNNAKYVDSFNNIAVQYTDEQLKIIVNCLPINIKAVLETECQRYQELMAVTGGIPSVKGVMSSHNIEGTIKNEISERKIGQAGKITKPIVIPSAVRNAKNSASSVVKKVPTAVPEQIEAPQKPAQRPVVKQVPTTQSKVQNTVKQDSKPSAIAPQKVVTSKPVQTEVRSQKQVVTPVKPVQTQIQAETSRKVVATPKPVEAPKPEIAEDLLQGLEDITVQTSETLEEKRGRGRPKKTLVVGAEVKSKGKRGRPRKITEDEEIDIEETILPGIEEDYVEETTTFEEPIMPEVETEEVSLPGFEDEYEEVEEIEEEDLLSGFEDEYEEVEEIEEEDLLPGFEDEYEEVEEYTEEVSLPGIDDLEDVVEEELQQFEDEYEEIEEDLLPGFEVEENTEELLPGFEETTEEYEEETLLPGMGFEDEKSLLSDVEEIQEDNYISNSLESIKPRVDYSMSSLNSLITKDKKIVTFIGTSKNGVSFLVNTLATLFSSLGINTAILDMTQNKNSYYIYTKNEEELRNIAFNSIEKLQNGYAEGIKVDKNLTIYTSLPNDGKDYSNAEPVLSTLVQNHSLILVDCDYETDISYFASCQEMYLVQSMDILTIQPLTAFLRELKTKGVLEPEKIRVVINKELKVKSLSAKAIIGGLSYYNDPAMSFMTELFNKDMVTACSIPFDEIAYSRYLEGIVNCNISLNDYSKAKNFLNKLKVLGEIVYPLTSKQSYNRQTVDYNQNNFSNSMNDTLNKMRKKY